MAKKKNNVLKNGRNNNTTNGSDEQIVGYFYPFATLVAARIAENNLCLGPDLTDLTRFASIILDLKNN